ncbi:MAG: endolytic transglycosylase MltG [Clostridia bacterium]|nr:endolytic transglycosylase MltG [Clostridia bacterium]
MKKLPGIFCLFITVLLILCSCVDGETAHEQTTQTETTEAQPLTVMLTFPEGMTVCEIAEKLEENSVCSAEEFMCLADDEATAAPYSFYEPEMNSSHRAFLLEGYIFPDTYEFYYNETAQSAIARFLDNTEQKLDGYRQKAQSAGYTLDEIITVASIMQEEAIPAEMKKVSSVLFNRLDSGMQLQCDVTIDYIENSVKPYKDSEAYAEYYNTYKCAALPEGPICSPGMEAIDAALEPEQTDYLFFVTDRADPDIYYYAADYSAHLDNCDTAGW